MPLIPMKAIMEKVVYVCMSLTIHHMGAKTFQSLAGTARLYGPYATSGQRKYSIIGQLLLETFFRKVRVIWILKACGIFSIYTLAGILKKSQPCLSRSRNIFQEIICKAPFRSTMLCLQDDNTSWVILSWNGESCSYFQLVILCFIFASNDVLTVQFTQHFLFEVLVHHITFYGHTKFRSHYFSHTSAKGNVILIP